MVDDYTYTSIAPVHVRVICEGETDRGAAEGRDRSYVEHRVPQLLAIFSRDAGTGRWSLASEGPQNMYTGPRATRDTRSGVMLVCPKHGGERGITTLRWRELGWVLDGLVDSSSGGGHVKIDVQHLRRACSTR